MSTLASKKYHEIINRSFKKNLNILILKTIVEEKEYENVKHILSVEHFRDFIRKMKIDPAFKEKYLDLDRKSHQCRSNKENFEGLKIKEIDEMFKIWLAENKTKPFKDIYILSFMKKEFFVKFYGNDSDHRSCHYCGISEKQIQQLIDKDEIKTKRLATRGRTMEIDRIRPNDDYDDANIVFCCYWCNNAKTDEFTEPEFLLVREQITQIWNNRLAKHGLGRIP